MEFTSMMPVLGLSEQVNSSFDFSVDYSDVSDFDACRKVDHSFVRNAIILGIFFFIGFLGNSFLMMVILSNPRLRNSANILLTNLALGDLLYVAASGPFFLEHELSPCWQYGHVACKLVNFTQGVGQGICVYTLTALSIERYSVLVRGGTIRHGGRTRRGVLAACTVWFIACMVATPILAYAHVKGGDSPQCFYTRLFSIEAQLYEILKALLMYIVPLVIIACLYTIIAHTLFKSAGAFAGETQPGARHFSARRRLALTVLLLALFFGTLWLPYYVFIVWFQLHPESISSMPGFHAFRNIYYFSSLANSCINPWIIFVMSTSHRKALMSFVRYRKHKPPPSTHVTHTRTQPNGIPGEKMKQQVDSRSGSRNTRCTEL